MDVVHPLAGNLAQSASVVQRQQSAGKAQQVRREQALRKDVAAQGDHFDHTVESCEELTPVHDEQPDERRGRSRPSQADEGGDKPQLDVTA